MGQQEVYDFLMKHPDQWYTSKQISEQLIVSIGSVTMSLKKLRKTNIIKFRNTGKRNTFQYMVQSEPAKLAERKLPMLEQVHAEPQRVKVKIKPKIVHQHTYLGGQTFYGVIRPAGETQASVLSGGDDSPAPAADDDDHEEQPRRRMVRRVVKRAAKKRVVARKSSAAKARKITKRAKKVIRAPRKKSAAPKRKMRRR